MAYIQPLLLPLIVVLAVVIFMEFFVFDRGKVPSLVKIPTEKQCDNCNFRGSTSEYELFNDLAPCGYLHRVDLYGHASYVTLLTEASFVCPQWKSIDTEKAQEEFDTYHRETDILELVEDDNPESWEEEEILDFGKKMIERKENLDHGR